MRWTIRSSPVPPRASGGGLARAVGLAVVATAAVACFATNAVAAQAPVGLGTATSYAVLAGSTVTNTGPSTINGDVGVTPGAAVIGFPPGTVNGTIHAADAAAGQAQSDLTTAYNDAAGRIPPVAIAGDLGGLSLTSGVYKSASAIGLTGALTLDAQGDPNSVFIFQAGSTLTTASGSRVNMINGASPCNVYWQVGSSATIGTTTDFIGNVLALQSISVNNAATVQGRLLARNGAVTLINDTINPGNCLTSSGTGPGGGSGPGGGPGGSGPTTGPLARNGSSLFTTTPRSIARTVARFGTARCVNDTFRVAVTGINIRRVVFSLDGLTVANRTRAPFRATIRSRGGIHIVRARVLYSDATPAATLRLRYRSCARAQTQATVRRAVSLPPRTTGGFTG
jgi:Ice-binding-like